MYLIKGKVVKTKVFPVIYFTLLHFSLYLISIGYSLFNISLSRIVQSINIFLVDVRKTIRETLGDFLIKTNIIKTLVCYQGYFSILIVKMKKIIVFTKVTQYIYLGMGNSLIDCINPLLKNIVIRHDN